MGTHRQPAVFVVTFNLVAMLEKLTGLHHWTEVRGPDSGCGLDYWYKSGRHVATINVDQSYLIILLDGETICAGDYTTNTMLAAFVSTRPLHRRQP